MCEEALSWHFLKLHVVSSGNKGPWWLAGGRVWWITVVLLVEVEVGVLLKLTESHAVLQLLLLKLL